MKTRPAAFYLLLGFLAALFLLAGHARAQCPPESEAGNRAGLSVFLLIGQSNMVGAAPLDNSVPLSETVLAWNGTTQTWNLAADPVNVGIPNYTGKKSLGLAFAAGLESALDSAGFRIYCPIGLVSCAVGGSCMYQWRPGGPRYNAAVLQCLAALAEAPGSHLDGILWYQGECETVSAASQAAYFDLCFDMILNLREDLYAPAVPFILFELSDTWPYNPESVNTSIRALGTTLPETAYVESRNVSSFDGGYHVDGPGLDTLGRRAAQAFLRIAPFPEPPSPWQSLHLATPSKGTSP